MAPTVLAKWARVIAGTVWGGLGVVVGLWLLEVRLQTVSAGWRGLELWGGLAALSAGEYVFLCIAADRLCPMNNRRVADVLQLALAGTCAVCLACCVISVFGGFA